MLNETPPKAKAERPVSVFDSGELDEVTFIKFTPEKNNTIDVRFLESEPTTGINKFGSPSYTFDVFDMDDNKVKPLSITSKRFMRELSAYRPLDGKRLCIKRIGDGMDIDYTVTAIRPPSE